VLVLLLHVLLVCRVSLFVYALTAWASTLSSARIKVNMSAHVSRMRIVARVADDGVLGRYR